MFDKKEFSGMRHNPFATGKGEFMWHKYKELGLHKVFVSVPNIPDEDTLGSYEPEEKDVDLMLRFVVLMADRHGNPLATIKDFDRRIDMAWDLLGVRKGSKGVWTFVKNEHRWYRDVLFQYFCIVNDDTYEMWVSLKMFFRSMMSALRHHIPGQDLTDMAKLRRDSASALDEIQRLELKLFGDERLKKIITEEAVVSERWAEQFAEDYSPVVA